MKKKKIVKNKTSAGFESKIPCFYSLMQCKSGEQCEIVIYTAKKYNVEKCT